MWLGIVPLLPLNFFSVDKFCFIFCQVHLLSLAARTLNLHSVFFCLNFLSHFYSCYVNQPYLTILRVFLFLFIDSVKYGSLQ